MPSQADNAAMHRLSEYPDESGVLHRAEVEAYRVPVRTRTGRVKRYEERNLVNCSCGQPLGHGLDYIDAVRVWREHKEAVGAR